MEETSKKSDFSALRTKRRAPLNATAETFLRRVGERESLSVDSMKLVSGVPSAEERAQAYLELRESRSEYTNPSYAVALRDLDTDSDLAGGHPRRIQADLVAMANDAANRIVVRFERSAEWQSERYAKLRAARAALPERFIHLFVSSYEAVQETNQQSSGPKSLRIRDIDAVFDLVEDRAVSTGLRDSFDMVLGWIDSDDDRDEFVTFEDLLVAIGEFPDLVSEICDVDWDRRPTRERLPRDEAMARLGL